MDGTTGCGEAGGVLMDADSRRDKLYSGVLVCASAAYMDEGGFVRGYRQLRCDKG